MHHWNDKPVTEQYQSGQAVVIPDIHTANPIDVNADQVKLVFINCHVLYYPCCSLHEDFYNTPLERWHTYVGF